MKQFFNKYIFVFAFCIISTFLFGQNIETGYKLVKVDLKKTTIKTLAKLGLEADHGFYAPGRFWMNYLSREEMDLLTNQSIPFTIEDKNSMQRLERNHYSCPDITDQFTDPDHFRLGTMAGYYTYADMIAILDTMHLLYPNLISSRQNIDTFKTFEGRSMQWLRISSQPDNDQGKPGVLFTALHHAREPMSLSQLIYFMWYLLENYDKDAEIKNLIDQTELYFIPCVNPDGYAYNEFTRPEGGGMWRKNRWPDPSGFYGVDLNRNYGWKWGIDNVGSSPEPLSQVYRGPAPFSEPETRAVAALVEKYKFNLVLNNHTFGNYVIYPWNYTEEPCLDDAAFKGIASVYAGQNNFAIGNTIQTVGYLSNGGSDDWIYGHDLQNITYSLTPEIGLSTDGFWPDASKIKYLCKTTLRGNIVFAEMAHQYFEVKFLEPLYLIKNKSNPLSLSINRVSAEAGPISLSLKIISGNADLDKHSFNLNMAIPEIAIKDITITPSSFASNNDKVLLEITRNMGFLTLKDTITLTIKSGQNTLTNTCDNLTTIIPDGTDWGLDMTEYHSAPASFGDSPGKPYHNQQNSGIVFNTPYLIPTDKETLLTYWLKWDIEGNFDYAQVYAITDDGEIPLCGKFTRPGTYYQKEGQPVYDGNSVVWLKEEVNMKDFAGQEILIGIRLVSDDEETRSGINIDDIELISYKDQSVNTFTVTASDITIYPNPSSGNLHISLPGYKDRGIIKIKDQLGRVVKTLNDVCLSNGIIDTDPLPSGLYFIDILTKNRIIGSKKWIKI
ncbi:MAG: T9SS type A sorting domain-containing protein [Saprospiraceae bacterium]|nr:T9SS type A sorting domain-containing protein [Saprospiraceae bacterium]